LTNKINRTHVRCIFSKLETKRQHYSNYSSRCRGVARIYFWDSKFFFIVCSFYFVLYEISRSMTFTSDTLRSISFFAIKQFENNCHMVSSETIHVILAIYHCPGSYVVLLGINATLTLNIIPEWHNIIIRASLSRLVNGKMSERRCVALTSSDFGLFDGKKWDLLQPLGFNIFKNSPVITIDCFRINGSNHLRLMLDVNMSRLFHRKFDKIRVDFELCLGWPPSYTPDTIDSIISVYLA